MDKIEETIDKVGEHIEWNVIGDPAMPERVMLVFADILQGVWAELKVLIMNIVKGMV